MPKTQLGKWSVVLITVMVVLILIGFSLADFLYESVPAGRTIPADLSRQTAYWRVRCSSVLLQA